MPSRSTKTVCNQLTTVHRVFTISDKEHLQTELNHLKLALQKNGHDRKDKTINMQTRQRSLTVQSDERILSILPHVKKTINRIGRILNKHNIRIIFKSLKKIGQILRNPKDRRPPLSSAGIYKIPSSCGQIYIGEWSFG